MHRRMTSDVYTRVGLGIFGFSGPIYSDFNHTRTSTESARPSTIDTATATTSSGMSNGTAASAFDEEVKEKKKAVHDGKGKERKACA